jgi:hypothetical protein
VIKLTTNTTQTIYLTLTEKVTLSNPKFLFEFINNESQSKYYCISANLSAFKERFDSFSIRLMASPNNLIGQINLSVGEYDYNVYEQTSTTNLNPSGLNKLENGKCVVFNSSPSTITEYNGASLTDVIYEGA